MIMMQAKFPKAEELQKAKWEAWKHVFARLEQLDNRIQKLEGIINEKNSNAQ